VRLTVCFEHDIDAAAEALLAVLRRRSQRDRASLNVFSGETTSEDAEPAA
jgi:hypothetical protein